MMKLRAACALAAALACGAVLAQDLGGKPLTLVVPFAPGGNADIVARSYAVPMARLIGATVVVDNRGGGGAIGTAIVAKAPADGSTLLRRRRANWGPCRTCSRPATSRRTSCRWAW